MRVFKTKLFHRWAKKHQLTDKALLNAVKEIEEGLIDANLGGNVYKKRIATKGRGKSGSVRTLLAYVKGDKTFYIYAFEKNDEDNISAKELEIIKIITKELLALSDAEIEKRKNDNLLFEIKEE
jgi:hypothetical protein